MIFFFLKYFTFIDYPRNPNILDNRALQEIAKTEIERQKEAARAKTAPSARERRRNWNVESVEIKTTKGERKVKAPGLKILHVLFFLYLMP